MIEYSVVHGVTMNRALQMIGQVPRNFVLTDIGDANYP